MPAFNQGVKLNGVKPEIAACFSVIDLVWKDLGVLPVVTSVTDGRHSRTSLHYVGFAVDVRSNNLTDDNAVKAAIKLRQYLTNEFDVINEKTHIHIEFQPKRES